jgi:hypothetical protein
LLKLPQEVLDDTIDKVFQHRAIEVSTPNGKARSSDHYVRRLVHIPNVCRKLRNDVVPIFSGDITLQIATCKYISMLLLDEWRITVHSDVEGFGLVVLRSLAFTRALLMVRA